MSTTVEETTELPAVTNTDAVTKRTEDGEWWPDVDVGDVVQHWNSAERPLNPSAAIVTSVLPYGRVSLSVVVKGSMSLQTVDKVCVPHCNQPGEKKAQAQRYGCWDISVGEKLRRTRMKVLESAIGKLNRKV